MRACWRASRRSTRGVRVLAEAIPAMAMSMATIRLIRAAPFMTTLQFKVWWQQTGFAEEYLQPVCRPGPESQLHARGRLASRRPVPDPCTLHLPGHLGRYALTPAVHTATSNGPGAYCGSARPIPRAGGLPMPAFRSRCRSTANAVRPRASLAPGLGLLLILLVPLAARGQSLDPATWRGDARFLAAAVDTIHPEPYLHHTRAEWAAAAEDLERRFPSLSYGQAVAGLSRMAALLGDRHSRLDQARLVSHANPEIQAGGPGFDLPFPIVCQIFPHRPYPTPPTPPP